MDDQNISNFLCEINFEHDFVVVHGDNDPLIRTAIDTHEDVLKFVEKIQGATNSRFIIRKTMPNLVRLAFHKKWVCQHSAFNKKNSSKRNAECGAFIDIKIKKVTKNTRYSDCFLKRSTPLPCIIKMNLKHSHRNDFAAALGMLKVKEDVKKQFQDYFNKGLKVSEARHYHEAKIIAEHGYEKLADASCNPTESQIHYIFKKWKLENYGTVVKLGGDESIRVNCNNIEENTVQESTSENASSLGKKALMKELQRIMRFDAGDANYQKLAKCFSNLKNKEDLEEMISLFSNFSEYKKKVKVEPLSLSR